MADRLVLVPGAEQFEDGEPVADGGVLRVGEDGADLVGGATAPALARGVDAPGSVHPEMAVQGEAALDAGEEMLAARDDVQDRPAGEVGGGESGDAQVGAGEDPACECGVQTLGGLQDGVSFGHASMMRGGERRDGGFRRAGAAPRGREEAGRFQCPAERGGQGRCAIGALHRDRAQRARAGGRRQRSGRREESRVVRVGGPGQQCLAATLHVHRELSVDQHDQGARLAAGLVTGAVRRLGPGQSRAVRVGRVRCGEDQGVGCGTRLRTVAGGGRGAQPVHRAVHRELRRPQALDDIAAPGLPVVLEGGQHTVRRGEAAFDALGLDRAPGHHPVAVQQRAGQGVSTVCGVGFGGGQQGPPARDGGRAGAGRGPGGGGERAVTPARDTASGAVGGRTRRAAGAEQRAQRGERVIGEPARPGQLPDGVGKLRIGAVRMGGGADLIGDLPEEQSVSAVQRGQDGFVQRAELQRVRGRKEQGCAVGEVEGQPAILAREGARTGPDDLAGGGQLVEHRGVVARDPARQDQLLQRRCRDGRALQLLDGTGQSVDSAQAVAAQVLPLRQEGGQGGGRNRFQLVAERGERTAAQPAQHGGVAPLLADAGGMELALDDPAGRGEPLQSPVGDGGAESEAGGGPGGGERTVRTGVPAEEIAERVLHRLGERLGDADREGGSQRVPEAARVFDRGPVAGSADPDPDGPAGRGQLRSP